MAGEAFERIKAGLVEARSIVTGETPAARIHMYGRSYVPAEERIVAAAMIYNGVICSLAAPKRHGDIINTISRSVGEANWPVNGEDGFVTSEGRFVGRNVAIEIARAAGQTESTSDTLFSEDLW